jgi:hypothetical protein
MALLIEALATNPEIVSALTAVAAFAISCISIYLSYLTLQTQRHHNVKSVTPVCHIGFADYENEVAVYISNVGIGPLMIEDVIIFDQNGKSSGHNLLDLMPVLPAPLLWCDFVTELEERVLSPKDRINLIRLEADPDNDDFRIARDKVRKTLSGLQITVRYRDIYQNSFPPKSRKGSFFGRNLIPEIPAKKAIQIT